MSSTSSALAAMKALRAEIESRLLRDNEDYRALVALDSAIEQVSPPVRGEMQPTTDLGKVFKDAGERMFSKPPTQPDAVASILEKHGPQPTSVLLEKVRELGVDVSGAEPLINLSSSISKSGRFQSVRISGVPHWWFKNRELTLRQAYPDLLRIGSETGAAAPAAEDTSGPKGGENGDAAA